MKLLSFTNICGRRVSDAFILIICILVIFVYGQIIEHSNISQDPLIKKFYTNCNDCDGWGIMHAMFFCMLGYLFPGEHLKFLMIGASWEVIEGMIGRVESGDFVMNLFGGWGKSTKEINPDGDRGWWYGRMGDIVFNTFGYTIGSVLASSGFKMT
jgi:hypothetical protein